MTFFLRLSLSSSLFCSQFCCDWERRNARDDDGKDKDEGG